MIPQELNADLLNDVDVVDRGAGRVVALAHGAGGEVAANFAPLFEAGADRYRWLGANYPGSGATPRQSSPLELAVLADRVVAAAAGTSAVRFPVVGLSLGSAVAVTAAHRHPDSVSALVLTVGLTRADAQSLCFIAAWRALHAAQDWEALARLMILVTGTAEDLAAMSGQQLDAMADEVRRGYPMGGVEHAELASRVDVRPLLSDIRVPTLVVVGGQDRIVLPQTVRELSAIPGARVLEYPGAGHIFGGAQASVWASDVIAFLDEHA